MLSACTYFLQARLKDYFCEKSKKKSLILKFRNLFLWMGARDREKFLNLCTLFLEIFHFFFVNLGQKLVGMGGGIAPL
jgi:predicted alpha/beta hydrolase